MLGSNKGVTTRLSGNQQGSTLQCKKCVKYTLLFQIAVDVDWEVEDGFLGPKKTCQDRPEVQLFLKAKKLVVDPNQTECLPDDCDSCTPYSKVPTDYFPLRFKEYGVKPENWINTLDSLKTIHEDRPESPEDFVPRDSWLDRCHGSGYSTRVGETGSGDLDHQCWKKWSQCGDNEGVDKFFGFGKCQTHGWVKLKLDFNQVNLSDGLLQDLSKVRNLLEELNSIARSGTGNTACEVCKEIETIVSMVMINKGSGFYIGSKTGGREDYDDCDTKSLIPREWCEINRGSKWENLFKSSNPNGYKSDKWNDAVSEYGKPPWEIEQCPNTPGCYE